MAEEIVAAYLTRSVGQSSTTTVHRNITRYEVWKEKTLVLRTVHQSQATRYAREINGEVHTVEQTGYRI
jgi:hypothetical protein